jgi:hypothetical protein
MGCPQGFRVYLPLLFIFGPEFAIVWRGQEEEALTASTDGERKKAYGPAEMAEVRLRPSKKAKFKREKGAANWGGSGRSFAKFFYPGG